MILTKNFLQMVAACNLYLTIFKKDSLFTRHLYNVQLNPQSLFNSKECNNYLSLEWIKEQKTMLQTTQIPKVILGRKPKQWKTYSRLRYPSDCLAWTTAVHYNITAFLLSVLTINYRYSTWPLKGILTRCFYIPEEARMYFLSLSNAIKHTTSLRGRVQRQIMHYGDMSSTP